MNKYWVGGNGKWSDINHWSATSGGQGGASVPTSADNVYFNVNSFTNFNQNVLIDINAECNDIDWTGVSFSPKLAGHSRLDIYGTNVKFISQMDITFDGWIKIHNSASFSGGGKRFDTVHFVGANVFTIADDNSFETLIADAGGTLKLKALSNQTIDQIKAVGILSNEIFIISDTEGVQATITCTEDSLNATHCAIKDIKGIGGAKFHALRCIDNGNNSGWFFMDNSNIGHLQPVDYKIAGLMIPEDKQKLDGISLSAKNVGQSITNGSILIDGVETTVYTHPEKHLASEIQEDSNHQFITEAQKIKLDSSYDYIHPATHPADMIVEDDEHQFVTISDKNNWDGKANATDVYTKTEVDQTISNVNQSISDINSDIGNVYTKVEVDTALGLKANSANVYTKAETDNKIATEVSNLVDSAPETLNTLNELSTALGDDPNFATTVANQIGQKADASNVYTKTEADDLLSNKVDKVIGKGLSTEDYTTSEKNKLAGIATNANNYVHPNTHAPSIIVQDVNNRFVTDAQIALWTGKADNVLASVSNNGLMSIASLNKLNAISDDADKVENSLANGNIKINDVETVVYTHPANHPASMITQTSSYRFVSDAEKTDWNSRATTAIVTTMANGLMTYTDKTKLDGISSGANKVQNSTTNGNIKVDGVETTVYTHPSSHPATMITQDSSNRFVSDTEKTTWNSKMTSLDGYQLTTNSITNVVEIMMV